VVDRETLRMGRAHRVADDDGRLEAHPIEEADQVRREITGAVAMVRPRGIAMTALRQREGVNRSGQMGQHRLEGMPGVGDAVQQQHRDARGVALLYIGQRDPTGKLDGRDDRCHILVSFSEQAASRQSHDTARTRQAATPRFCARSARDPSR
jgi:hypothetical protein